jgi:hypothetical protein
MEGKYKIYESVTAIMKGVQAIGKNKKNEQQGFKYRGIDDVMNELHGLFAENSVAYWLTCGIGCACIPLHTSYY